MFPTHLHKRQRILWFAFWSSIVVLGDLIVMRYVQSLPEEVILGITLDFALTIPILFYFYFVRQGAPAGQLAIVFVASMAFAHFAFPD